MSRTNDDMWNVTVQHSQHPGVRESLIVMVREQDHALMMFLPDHKPVVINPTQARMLINDLQEALGFARAGAAMAPSAETGHQSPADGHHEIRAADATHGRRRAAPGATR